MYTWPPLNICSGNLPIFRSLFDYSILISFAVAVRALELSCNEGLATIYFRSGHHEKALGYSEKVWGGHWREICNTNLAEGVRSGVERAYINGAKLGG